VFGAGRLVLTGAEATEQAFQRHAPRADLIHLASHAVFREDNPLFSAIRLADGWLSLYDLYRLRLRASLVTLSACETGVSQVLAGDELVGLSRGFFEAGAASVVVSLWSVDDESTARLMERFYAGLAAGLGPAVAMRRAQAELRPASSHPYYWAPFVVIGRP
jgi:CHAT domain-containing protein